MKADAMTEVWAGGEHAFRLGIGEIRALQKACEAGPMMVLARLMSSQWLIDDVLETLRLALVGGGMDAAKAKPLVLKAAEETSLLKLALLAAKILNAYVVEDPHDAIDLKEDGDASGELPTRPDGGASPGSMAPAP